MTGRRSLMLLIALAACRVEDTRRQSNAAAAAMTDTTPRSVRVQQALLEPNAPHLVAGAARPGAPMPGPFDEDSAAIHTGAQLFVVMNCNGCHGDDGVGSWCPALDDGRWRYGGSAANVFQTIYGGRPFGMPAFRNVLTEEQIWQLAAYVRSLSKGKNPATESWTTKVQTVKRTGG